MLALLLFALTADTIDQRVEKLLSQMTLEEKLGQLTMVGYDQKKDRVGAVLTWGTAKDLNELQRRALASRLEIPLLIGYDVIHGYATTFPIPLAIASTAAVFASCSVPSLTFTPPERFSAEIPPVSSTISWTEN